MKISVDFTSLRNLARQMGDYANIVLPPNTFRFEPIDSELEDGTRIDPSKYSITNGLLPTYEGRQVVLYIKDHSYVKNNISLFDETLKEPGKGNKIHIAECKTLENMRKDGRYERYVVCNNITGLFSISGTQQQEAEVALHVCRNCLNLLNYQGARDSASVRSGLASDFDYKQFFKTYSSFFSHMPKGMATDNVSYTKDWPQLSEKIRKQAGYVCESCKVNLKEHKSLCHVHHINGVKSDNSTANLEVLCADCHRKRHGSLMFVSHHQIKLINRLRNHQSIKPDNWEQALELVDPALHGELLLLRKKGYEAPEIGYEINNADGAVIAELEAAWPTRKECILIDSGPAPVQLAGWHVLQPGSIARA